MTKRISTGDFKSKIATFKMTCDLLDIIADKSDVYKFLEQYEICDTVDVKPNLPSESCIVYVLELEDGKFYVGRSDNERTFEIRMIDHEQCAACEWTKEHHVIKVLEKFENCDKFDEDKFTLKMMRDHGIDNVRGGSFCELNFSDGKRKLIQTMLNGGGDACYNCNENGHYAKECTAKRARTGRENRRRCQRSTCGAWGNMEDMYLLVDHDDPYTYTNKSTGKLITTVNRYYCNLNCASIC